MSYVTHSVIGSTKRLSILQVWDRMLTGAVLAVSAVSPLGSASLYVEGSRSRGTTNGGPSRPISFVGSLDWSSCSCALKLDLDLWCQLGVMAVTPAKKCVRVLTAVFSFKLLIKLGSTVTH